MHLPPRCMIKLKQHTVLSDDTLAIAPPTLQFTWKFYPFVFPLTVLENTQHLDHMLYHICKKISFLGQTIQILQRIPHSLMTYSFMQLSLLTRSLSLFG